MRVTKSFHFYAAHRNQYLVGSKCEALHGHRYGIEVTVDYPVKEGVSILFSDIEDQVQPLINELDHSLLLDENDIARDALVNSGACGRVYEVPFPTSAENMCNHIFQELLDKGLNVVRLCLRETDSSVIEMERDDLYSQ